MPSKLDNELATETKCKQMVPVWIQRMRDMASKHLTEDVVESIILNQIQAAKKGDRNAIRFVFDQLMGGQALKGATFIQNNYGSEFGESAASPTPALPGTPEKLATMRKRVANGQSLTQAGDAGVESWECSACENLTKAKPTRCVKCGAYSFNRVRGVALRTGTGVPA